MVSVFYSEPSVTVIVEDETLPFAEFSSEFANIIGLYFGISMLSVACLINKLSQECYRRKMYDSKATKRYLHSNLDWKSTLW